MTSSPPTGQPSTSVTGGAAEAQAGSPAKPLREQFGVVYAATGSRFLGEAENSARSVREHMPNIGLAIATDRVDEAKALELFDHVYEIQHDDGSDFGMKWKAILLAPFERNFFLDTDTYALASFYELIPLLDSFDIAFCHEPGRFNEKEPDIPYCFCEPNGGVILYKRSDEVMKAMQQIYDLYLEKLRDTSDQPLKISTDQGLMRRVFYQNRHLRLYVLPPEYNLRAYAPWFAAGRVKIIHTRGEFLRKAIRVANRHSEMRTGAGMGFFRRQWFVFKHMIKPYLPFKVYRMTPRTFEYMERQTSLDTTPYEQMP